MAGVRDHPRSRGVHPGGPVLTGLSGGSSPLARGAPVECCAPDVAGRIIPARAGCTLRRPRRSAATRDHPRSRGVHFTASRAFSNAVGSSPLARGALATITGHTPQNRIIPARAGCTCTKNDSWRRVADHPRSRGVHLELTDGGRRFRGSSPLARGALPVTRDRVQPHGIIPARAGCTPRHPRSRPAPRDHPRSRGVHATLVGPGFCHTGSSPLARGALTKNLKTSGGIGIIPARAGCTRRGVHVMAGVC